MRRKITKGIRRVVKGLDTSRLQLFPIENYTITVTDGDSLLLIGGGKKVSVRLAGIDTPELKKAGKTNPIQRLGQAGNLLGKRYLQQVIDKHRHEIRLWIVPGQRSHGRVLGYITIGKRNINLELIELGLARALTNPESSTYSPAANNKAFKRAMQIAMIEKRGIFKSSFHRALAQETADVGGLSYVRMTTPELLGGSFERRVRMQRVLAGMARGDHRRSTYGGFLGMQTGRPDFGASRDPTNPVSMGVIQSMFQKLGFKGDLLMSLDIESTGLDYTDVVTFAGEVDISKGAAPSSFETFINPKYPTSTEDNLGKMLDKGAEHRFRRKAMNAALKTGGHMTNVLPGGRRMDVGTTREMLQQSGMSYQMKGKQQPRIPDAGGMDPEDFMRRLFNKFKGKKNGWVFIHNAQFESRMLSAAIPEDVWKRALESGDLASGNTSRRYLYNAFDVELQAHKDLTSTYMLAGEHTNVAKSQASWLDRFVDIFTKDPAVTGVASGVKIIDTQDIVKGVFAKAHLAGQFQDVGKFSTHGLISQDALTTILGMGAEVHMPVADAGQNLEMVARMLKFSEELDAGKLSVEGKAFFASASTLQKDMQIYSLYKDVANQIRDIQPGVPVAEYQIPIRGDVPKKLIISEEGVSWLGGKKRLQLSMPSPSYPLYEEGRTTALDYVTKRLKTLDADIDPEELLQLAFKSRRGIAQVSQSQMIEALGTKEFQAMTGYLARHEAIITAISAKALETPTPTKTTKSLSDLSLPGSKNVQAWWNSLQPTSKTAIKGAGAIAAVVGVLGMIRGFTEDEMDAQPRTMQSMEEYVAMRQQGVHQNHGNSELASMISSYRMVPNRYPTKV